MTPPNKAVGTLKDGYVRNVPLLWAPRIQHLVPGHVAHSFLCVSSSNSMFDPVASFLSTVNLHWDCHPSLLKALATTHPDQEVWLQSYYEEKQGIDSLATYCKITLGEYQALCEKGFQRLFPLCVSKKDENLLPFRAKSWVVVLGNHEDRIWSKSDSFPPVLRGESLRFLISLAVKKHRPLCQGNCKNAFCQGILPPEEITIVRPPAVDPDANPNGYWLLQCMFYGLCCSPCHWYDKINKSLKSISLCPSLEDPCLYMGCIVDPYDPTVTPSSIPLSHRLYVYNFVYFSEDPTVEAFFCHLLGECCKVDFMGIGEWFLGVHFSWWITPVLSLFI